MEMAVTVLHNNIKNLNNGDNTSDKETIYPIIEAPIPGIG